MCGRVSYIQAEQTVNSVFHSPGLGRPHSGHCDPHTFYMLSLKSTHKYEKIPLREKNRNSFVVFKLKLILTFYKHQIADEHFRGSHGALYRLGVVGSVIVRLGKDSFPNCYLGLPGLGGDPQHSSPREPVYPPLSAAAPIFQYFSDLSQDLCGCFKFVFFWFTNNSVVLFKRK